MLIYCVVTTCVTNNMFCMYTRMHPHPHTFPTFFHTLPIDISNSSHRHPWHQSVHSLVLINVVMNLAILALFVTVLIRSRFGSSAFYFYFCVSVVADLHVHIDFVSAMSVPPPMLPYPISRLPDEVCVATDNDILVFKWHRSISKVTPNHNGTSGWATIIRSLNGTIADDTLIRVHVCVHDPCQAVHHPFEVWNRTSSTSLSPPPN